jgi:TetR/AcrR family transcriptional regulator, regulator of autoinduction and epiphytic fitness
MAAPTRSYRSPRRQEQAEETRRQILAGARALFTTQGYGGASMEAIARRAGVAVQTLYSSYGSKRAILFALLDQMAVEADPGGLDPGAGAGTGDALRQLQAQVAFTTRFYAHGSDLIELARTLSGVEPDLGEMWREGESRRHRRQSRIVGAWKRNGVLSAGLTALQATDLMWALSGPDLYRRLVIERGWSARTFERWLFETLAGALFGRGGVASGRSPRRRSRPARPARGPLRGR